VHPEMNFRIAVLRHEELISARRFPRAAPAGRRHRGLFRRHRDTHHAATVHAATIVLLPPPREERDPAGHDQRVA